MTLNVVKDQRRGRIDVTIVGEDAELEVPSSRFSPLCSPLSTYSPGQSSQSWMPRICAIDTLQ